MALDPLPIVSDDIAQQILDDFNIETDLSPLTAQSQSSSSSSSSSGAVYSSGAMDAVGSEPFVDDDDDDSVELELADQREN